MMKNPYFRNKVDMKGNITRIKIEDVVTGLEINSTLGEAGEVSNISATLEAGSHFTCVLTSQPNTGTLSDITIHTSFAVYVNW